MATYRALMAFSSLCLMASGYMALKDFESPSSQASMRDASSLARFEQGQAIETWMALAKAGGSPLCSDEPTGQGARITTLAALSGRSFESAKDATSAALWADPSKGPSTLRLGPARFPATKFRPASASIPWTDESLAALAANKVPGLSAEAQPDGSALLRFSGAKSDAPSIVWARIGTGSHGKITLSAGALRASEFVAMRALNSRNSRRVAWASAEGALAAALAVGAAGLLSAAKPAGPQTPSPRPSQLGQAALMIARREDLAQTERPSARRSTPKG